MSRPVDRSRIKTILREVFIQKGMSDELIHQLWQKGTECQEVKDINQQVVEKMDKRVKQINTHEKWNVRKQRFNARKEWLDFLEKHVNCEIPGPVDRGRIGRILGEVLKHSRVSREQVRQLWQRGPDDPKVKDINQQVVSRLGAQGRGKALNTIASVVRDCSPTIKERGHIDKYGNKLDEYGDAGGTAPGRKRYNW